MCQIDSMTFKIVSDRKLELRQTKKQNKNKKTIQKINLMNDKEVL